MPNRPDDHALALDMIEVHGTEAAGVARGNARAGYHRVKSVDIASHVHQTGCNDNDDPDRDTILSQAALGRMATGYVAPARPAGARRNTDRLRELARWYRDFAERAGSPNIWERRVHTAEDLEAEACRIELIPW